MRLAQRVADKPLLTLIGKMLKAWVVLPDGVVVSTDEGVPERASPKRCDRNTSVTGVRTPPKPI